MVRTLQYASVQNSFNIGAQIHPYTFCYPNLGGNPFFVALNQEIPTANDQVILNHLLTGRAEGIGIAELASMPPDLPSGFRYYDITSLIPSYVQEKLGTSEYIPGPNCYHTVMTSLCGDRFRERYVHDEEMSYYLTRDFRVSSNRDVLGAALIYKRSVFGSSGAGFAAGMDSVDDPPLDIAGLGLTTFGVFTIQLPNTPKPSRIPRIIGDFEGHAMSKVLVKALVPDVGEDDFLDDRTFLTLTAESARAEEWRVLRTTDPGVHGAIMLLGGMVFQKGCFGTYCGYRIVPADKGMSSIEIKQERWTPRREPEKDDRYRYTSYVLTDRDPVERFGFNLELSDRLSPYVTLMRHYLQRFRAIKDKSWSDFKENRIDLLSVENIWKVLRDMQELMRGEPSTMNALLRIDPEIAEMFLELKSFKWQYQAMADKFDPFKNTCSREKTMRKLEELYRDHYINPDSEVFRDEIIAHLQMREVAEGRWDEIIAAVVGRVGGYDPVEFSKSNGAKGIPFAEILDEVIG